MTNTTIDILARELQNKENRIAKLREKLIEQQEHLKYKIKRINELKEQLEKLDGKYQEASHYADKFNADLKEANEEIASLKDEEEVLLLKDEEKQFEIKGLRKEMTAMAEELSYSRGEHPRQKATNRKKTNGKSRKTIIN